jgi:hypothetical protein
MPFKFFIVPIHDAGQAEAELNGFLRSHRVLSVDRRWVEQGSSSFWSFCVDYLETSSGATSDARPVGQRGKVDYKEVLSPEEFAVFARLSEGTEGAVPLAALRRGALLLQEGPEHHAAD